MIGLKHLRALVAAALLMAPAAAWPAGGADSYGGREMIVFTPSHPPPSGKRALVIVLHGGLGAANRILSAQAESGLNLNAEAERDSFIVAYLNGTPVTRRLGPRFLGWNSGGGCCGAPAENGVDDVAYIQGAVGYLEGKYGVDPARVFAIGHSNGAMMAQRLMCETRLLAAAVAISGPLNLPVQTCPSGRGRILAIHGQEDRNVPIAGGRGTRGISGAVFASEEHGRQVFTASGASYDLQIVGGADHSLAHIDQAIQKTEGMTIAQKAARFFGLAGQGG